MTDSGVKSCRYVATAGMFDGVHRGHQFLLRQLAAEAHRRSLQPLVFTFSRHPLEIIAPQRAPKLLTTPGQRIDLIRELSGIEHVELLDSTPEFLRTTGRAFLEGLHRDHHVDAFAMGFNNHIGSDGATAATLDNDAPVDIIALPEMESDEPINSTAVRSALTSGDINAAERILGHRWQYRGKVVGGKRLGRTIGFPTANIEGERSGLILPPNGVYAVDITLPDGLTRRGMANIGCRPTVDAPDSPATLEVNIFGFDSNIYGAAADITFLRRLRDEKPFANLEELRRQLEADRSAAEII